MRRTLRQHLVAIGMTFALIAGGGMALAGVDAMAPTAIGPACPSDEPTPTPTDGEATTSTGTEDADTSTGTEGADTSTGTEDGPNGSLEGEPTGPALEPVDGGEEPGEELTGDDSDGDCDGEGEGEGDEDGGQDEPTEEDTSDPDADEDATVEPDADRTIECNDAAGLDPSDAGDDAGPATGLDNAIARVLANCLKNPDAPGLPNALRHLVENRTAKAERDAAKAAGARGNSANAPGHTRAHGSSAGGAHGNSANAPGHTGEHGNPHD